MEGTQKKMELLRKVITHPRDADLSLFRPPFCFPVAADT